MHVDIVKIAGIGPAGIGSNFDCVSCSPEGLDDVAKFPNDPEGLWWESVTSDAAVEAKSKRLRWASAEP